MATLKAAYVGSNTGAALLRALTLSASPPCVFTRARLPHALWRFAGREGFTIGGRHLRHSRSHGMAA